MKRCPSLNCVFPCSYLWTNTTMFLCRLPSEGFRFRPMQPMTLILYSWKSLLDIRVYIQANSKLPMVYRHFWRKKKRLLRKFQLFETYAAQGNLLSQYPIAICWFSNITKEIVHSGERWHSSGGVFICKTHYIWNIIVCNIMWCLFPLELERSLIARGPFDSLIFY